MNEGRPVRAARSLATLDDVESGDHVCQFLEPAENVVERSRAFVADGALFGDKLVIVGRDDRPAPEIAGAPARVVLDPARLDGSSLLAAVRREAASAGREGFRALRVLRHVTADHRDGRRDAMLQSELDLEEFAADSGAMVLCTYRPADWDPPALDQVRCVHPHHVGSRPAAPEFRVYTTGEGRWTVSGVIDSEGAAAFGAVLRGLVAHAATLRLICHDLEFFDAAGMRALADAARFLPERVVIIEGANETVRLSWGLSGYAVPEVPVVMVP
ncbi:MEDS domain-containing protein [Streptomyces sp. NPDC057052]|uniref:MEDS domain-containing protein n=1 Tax=Streptomyces sp. NPDC057052 TaxID=3346010 RepID=UPI00363EDE2E